MDLNISERIKEVRKMFQYNQADFAKALGISQAHISNMEKGNDKPSATLLKLICVKFNIDEKWLESGEGYPIPGWDAHTDEGVISKYNEMRVTFEQILRKREGTDLKNSVEAFSYFVSLFSPKKLRDEPLSEYLKSVCLVIDEFEKLIFLVSSTSEIMLSTKDAKSWIQFKNDCHSRMQNISDNTKDAANLYISKYGDEMILK